MAIKSLSILKSWFETGDKPTEAQFSDLLDSFRHKNDNIPVGSLSGFTWDNLAGKPSFPEAQAGTVVLSAGTNNINHAGMTDSSYFVLWSEHNGVAVGNPVIVDKDNFTIDAYAETTITYLTIKIL